MKYRIAAVALLLSLESASAAEDGTWLCLSPVIANNLWTDIQTAHQAGVQITREVAAAS